VYDSITKMTTHIHFNWVLQWKKST